MLSEQISKSAVRIFDLHTNVIGCGFFFEGNVFTCAHVVNQALGFPSSTSGCPNKSIKLDFPLLKPQKYLTGNITTWLPKDDIARLEIVTSESEDSPKIKFITASDLWGHSFRAYGFPPGHDQGVWASGQILHRVSNGWLEVEDQKQTGYFVQPGFSGGAAWDEQYQGIVGMVVGSDVNPNTRVAYIIPISKFVEIFPVINKNATSPIDNDLDKIKEQIRLGSYNRAYEGCRKASVLAPNHALLSLLTAISLLKGIGADKIQTKKIQRIEIYLSEACSSPNLKYTALAILAIIKYDHYVVNGLDEGNPSIDELKHNLHESNLSQMDRSLVDLVKASNGALSYLGLK